MYFFFSKVENETTDALPMMLNVNLHFNVVPIELSHCFIAFFVYMPETTSLDIFRFLSFSIHNSINLVKCTRRQSSAITKQEK